MDSLASLPIREKVDAIIDIMKDHPDSAINLSHELMNESKSKNHEYGLVQSNFILGYIYDKIQVDYGKAIIFYLEAIRYAKEATYPDANKNLISLHKNCGVIFRKFKSYELAKEYYSKGLKLSKSTNAVNQIVSIQYNLSGVYQDEEDFITSIKLLEDILNYTAPDSYKYYEALNRLTYSHLHLNHDSIAEKYAKKIAENSNISGIELTSYAYHNLGAIYSKKDVILAEKYLSKALETLSQENSTNDKSDEFKIQYDRGENYFAWGSYQKALSFYKEAEILINQVSQLPEYFSLYKSIANLHFDLQQFEEAKKYEDLYSESLNNYLEVQEKIQETDKRYNMDLITKRYFDEVAKQERVASLLFQSKLISGSLVVLLLLTVGFNRYQRNKLRKSIAKDLTDLNLFD